MTATIVHQDLEPAWVTLDGEHLFKAKLGIDAKTGTPLLWNGFAAYPLFDEAEFRRLVEQLRETTEGDWSSDQFTWHDDDTLLRIRPADHPGDDPEAVHADVYRITASTVWPGLWSIGGYEWVWSICDADLVEESGHDPGGRYFETACRWTEDGRWCVAHGGTKGERVQHRCTRTDAHTIAQCLDWPEAH